MPSVIHSLTIFSRFDLPTASARCRSFTIPSSATIPDDNTIKLPWFWKGLFHWFIVSMQEWTAASSKSFLNFRTSLGYVFCLSTPIRCLKSEFHVAIIWLDNIQRWMHPTFVLEPTITPAPFWSLLIVYWITCSGGTMLKLLVILLAAKFPFWIWNIFLVYIVVVGNISRVIYSVINTEPD